MTAALRIGTRGSALALWQARWVRDRLAELFPGHPVEIREICTTGDRVQNRRLDELGVQGAFTRELDAALLSGEVDVAVHSLKDLPVLSPEGLCLAAIPERAEVADGFIGKAGRRLDELAPGALVATGSLRRQAQLKARRPDLRVEAIRGNVDTRLRKLDESADLAGIILAAAGVVRLNRQHVVTEYLTPPEWLPAPGQGALAVVVRDNDKEIRGIAEALDRPELRCCVSAERALLGRVEGGCHVPVGAWARLDDDRLELHGLVAALDGRNVVRGRRAGPVEAAQEVGQALGEELLERGGAQIIASLPKRNNAG